MDVLFFDEALIDMDGVPLVVADMDTDGVGQPPSTGTRTVLT